MTMIAIKRTPPPTAATGITQSEIKAACHYYVIIDFHVSIFTLHVYSYLFILDSQTITTFTIQLTLSLLRENM